MKGFYKNFKMTTGVFLMSVFFIIIILLIGLNGINNMKKINHNMEKMYKDRLIPITDVTSIRADFVNIRVYVNKAMKHYDSNCDSKIKDYDSRISKRLKEYMSTNMDDVDTKQINEFKKTYVEYINIWENARKDLEQGRKVSIEQLNKSTEVGERIEESIKALKDHDLEVAHTLYNNSQNTYINNSKYFIIILAIVLVLSSISCYSSTRMMKNCTNEITLILDKLSKGDLTVDICSDGKNEFEVMKKSLQKALKNVSNMINNIKAKSKIISDTSESLNAVSEEMASSTENVSNSIQDVAKGTGEQAQDLVSITGTLNNFGTSLDEMVVSIEDINSKSNEIENSANKSNGEMQRLIETIVEMRNTFKKFTQKIDELGININQINDITDIINGIAEQTNLLALNAAIEAARAGEAGSGFAVVAEEIRKLAEQSKDSSENISNLVIKISSETNQIVSSSSETNEELKRSTEVINNCIASFKIIINSLNEINPKIQSTNNIAVKINKEKNIILEKVEGASSISQEVSASSEEIAASSEQMSASTEEVAQTAENFREMTKEVLDIVGVFKLN